MQIYILPTQTHFNTLILAQLVNIDLERNNYHHFTCPLSISVVTYAALIIFNFYFIHRKMEKMI